MTCGLLNHGQQNPVHLHSSFHHIRWIAQRKMIIQFCFLGGKFQLYSWKGVPPPPPWQKMPRKRLTFFNPSLTLMNLILQKSIICFFPEIVNIPHILDILDILLRLVYLTSLALLIFFVLVFHKILSYNGYNGKSDLSCNSQFSCYP